MPIKPKSEAEIAIMRMGGKLLAELFIKIEALVRPGAVSKDIDSFAYDFITRAGAKPSFKGYKVGGAKYPASICASRNDEVIHGIPNRTPFNEGDIVGIDIGLNLRGYHVDAARTYAVGTISAEAARLVKTTEEAFFTGVAVLKANVHLGDLSAAIQSAAERAGYSVVRQFAGHGIGSKLHEEPQVSNHGKAGEGPTLPAGTTIAIEPMINAGVSEVLMMDDDWTIVTRDGMLSSHYEHTVLITETGYEILTALS
ncbi:MAG: type I methionyl aminopeptidase [Spirochaetota bacterium]